MNKIVIGILKILILIILFLICFYFIFYDRLHKSIRKNWKKYKNNPFFLPIAGLFKPEGDQRSFIQYTKYNFDTWFWGLSKNFFSYLIKPIQYILNIITKIISSFQNTLDTFRYQAKIIRKMFADIVLSTASKMSNSYSAIKFYQAKLNDSVSRQKAIFQIIVYFTEAVLMTISSLINGPIISLVYFFPIFGVALLIIIAICIVCGLGIPFVSWVACPICALCFSPETPIRLSSSIKHIKNIKIGDILYGGGHVNSILIFDIKHKKCQLYNYNGVILSGSHLVIENKKPIRIEYSKKSIKIKNHQIDKLYCLITSNHHIYIDDTLYADFHECTDSLINQTNMLYMLNTLNEINISYKLTKKFVEKLNFNNIEIPYYQWGFDGNTQVILLDNTTKPISALQLGDVLLNGNQVYGTIIHSTHNIILYNFEINGKNIILSGTQIIYWENSWKRVYAIEKARPIVKNNIPYIFNILTTNHTFNIGDLLVRDYLEINETDKIFDSIHLANQLSFS